MKLNYSTKLKEPHLLRLHPPPCQTVVNSRKRGPIHAHEEKCKLRYRPLLRKKIGMLFTLGD
ncbi:hypothetical protein OUZ56_028463 [Daphnia magna]|uniref:Uncharacterized protein n=1 Tax=Daphnia magna TaxID=35525 RepID=A0ABR0B433_9CRUS|nr:hypothetical protein OUZ56_028463 [Daphnia magna]